MSLKGLRSACDTFKGIVGILNKSFQRNYRYFCCIVWTSGRRYDFIKIVLRIRRYTVQLFPPQVRHGRGAGVLRSAEALRQMGECVLRHGEMEFSVKMRLGVDNAGEWHAAMDVLNELPLRRVTVHPRVATQQYGGEPDLEEAALVMEACAHPVVYNGDVRTAADIDRVLALFPKAAGVMIGRGLLSSPWMAREWLDGEALTAAQRIDGLRRMHDGILAHYEETLCGDTQVLMKIKPLWEYLGAGAGRKELKAIKKATKLGAYRQAAEAALSSIGAGQSS